MGQVERQALEGVIVHQGRNPEALAQGFVEMASERDFDELPEPARLELIAWCTAFIEWDTRTPLP